MADLAFSNVASSAVCLVDVSGSAWSGVPRMVSHNVPPAIPRDQAYYWTARWQAGIEHSRAALARGDFREFDNGRDLARWLLSDDD